MTHKKFEIDIYFGDGSVFDEKDIKERIRKYLRETYKGENVAFEITEKDPDLEELEKIMKKYPSPSFPIPEMPYPGKPLVPGDTPETFRWQPTCTNK